jgi:hypothetical protein
VAFGRRGVDVTDILTTVAWPVATVGCIVFVCIFFRKQFAALLDRTTSLGKEGLKTSPPTGQATQELDKLKQAQQLMEALTSPVIREREDLIHQELKAKGLEDESETAKVLIRYLATAQLIVTFEELYRVIFGSQIFLLRTANENRAAGLHKSFVQRHFSNVQEMFAPTFQQWTVENYLHFVLNSRLLIDDEDFYRISNLGVEFLEWIVKVGAPEQKGL